MANRKELTARTVAAVARENAGHPLNAEQAAAYAEAFEPILQAMDSLRALPLKDAEPAVVFQPIGKADHV